MNNRRNELVALVADIRRLVEGAAPAAGLGPFAEYLNELGAGVIDEAPPDAPFGLPVCRFWQPALRATKPPVQGIAAALLGLGPCLAWTQNPNYLMSPPADRFLDDYGYAVIAGPRDGPPALLRNDACALGVLLLGPETLYPRHLHPAMEVYLPLTAAEWWREDGPWRIEPAGTVIFHGSNVPHATRTTAQPLLAVYMWLGELAIHARMVPGP